MKIPASYYTNSDVVFLAKKLLGKLLITTINGIKTGGIITETEAYSEVGWKKTEVKYYRQKNIKIKGTIQAKKTTRPRIQKNKNSSYR